MTLIKCSMFDKFSFTIVSLVESVIWKCIRYPEVPRSHLDVVLMLLFTYPSSCLDLHLMHGSSGPHKQHRNWFSHSCRAYGCVQQKNTNTHIQGTFATIRLVLWCSLTTKTQWITLKNSRSMHRRQKVRRCRAWGDRDRWRQTEPQTAQDSWRQTPVSRPTSWHTARQITTVSPRPTENTNRKSYIHTTANSTRQLSTNSGLTANQLKHSRFMCYLH